MKIQEKLLNQYNEHKRCNYQIQAAQGVVGPRNKVFKVPYPRDKSDEIFEVAVSVNAYLADGADIYQNASGAFVITKDGTAMEIMWVVRMNRGNHPKGREGQITLLRTLNEIDQRIAFLNTVYGDNRARLVTR